MKCVGDCPALKDGGREVQAQIPVLDLWEWIEAAQNLGAEARTDYEYKYCSAVAQW